MITTSGIAKKLAILLSRLMRFGYDDGITSHTKTGGKYWKKLLTSQKMNFINTALNISRDNENADPHLGDLNFQNAVIGQSPDYVAFLNGITSRYYREEDKRKDVRTQLAHNFPEKLNDNIEKSIGSYRYSKLIQRDALYQLNPNVENSRARRYVDIVEHTDKVKDVAPKVKFEGKPKPLPTHSEAKLLVFQQLSTLWAGVMILMDMDYEKQNEHIVEGLAPNTNSGYPDFVTQTKDNIGKLFWLWMKSVCPPVHNKWSKILKKELKVNPYVLTVNMIFECIKYVNKKRWYEPSINFYRTQGDKVRSVFGGTVLLKVLGAMIHAAKKFGYTVEVHQKLTLPVVKHWDKQLVSYGGLPCMAQLDWDVLFRDIRDRIPKVVDGKVSKFTPAQMRNLFGYKCDEDVFVEVVGEDIEAYDTGVIEEDISFLREHPDFGFVMDYLLNWLTESPVWVGGLQIWDIFFKSGHPWTSDIGSFNHINMAFTIRDYIRKKKGECELVAFTVLSDDSLFWWIGFDMKIAIECMNIYGYVIKDSQSFVFSRDKVIAFLKVLIGYVFDENEIVFVGDFQSRYLKLAHSEREIEQENAKKDRWKANVNGVYRITDDIELDSLISKLASFGEKGGLVVMEILRIIRDTALGRSAIKIISGMSDKDQYELYRSDVLYGFKPNWLSRLPVQSLLNPKLTPSNA